MKKFPGSKSFQAKQKARAKSAPAAKHKSEPAEAPAPQNTTKAGE